MKNIIIFSFFLIFGVSCSPQKKNALSQKPAFRYEVTFSDGNSFRCSSEEDIISKFLEYPIEKRNGLLKMFLSDENSKTTFLSPFVGGDTEGEHIVIVEPPENEASRSKSFGRVVVNYKKGLREGLVEAYINDKDLYVRGHYNNDYADGEWLYNYSNGNPGAILNYKDGFILGKLFFYKEDGTLLAEGEADEKGSLDGLFIHPMATFYRHLNRPVGHRVFIIKVRDREIVYEKEFFMDDLVKGKVEPEWENF